jgi:hypothetical protein
VIGSVGRVLLALGISAWLAGAAVTVRAQTPQQTRDTIRLQPPPAPKPNTSNQLSAPSAASTSAIAAAAPQTTSLDEAFHTADQATPIVPVTPVQPKTVRGPISVQAPKSAGPSAPAYIAIPAVPAAAAYPAPAYQAAPQRPAFQAPNPGPPPAEIRDLATLSEPAVANAPQRLEQPGPERLAQTAPASDLVNEIAGPVADGSTELTTSPLDASTLNTASVAFGILGVLVAIGAVAVTRRSRS